MELLVVTLAHMAVERVADMLACASMVSDTLRNAPGLLSTRLYRSRGEGKRSETSCLLCTTWEDDASWLQARERYNPRTLFQNLANHPLSTTPEQWFMRYLWGYNRPTAAPVLASVHLATTCHDQLDYAQRSWLKGLRRQAIQPNLSFAFLAYGIRDEGPVETTLSALNEPSTWSQTTRASKPPEPVFLNLFSWSSEAELEGFYASPYYSAVDALARSIGKVRLLSLEPVP